jgi:hypothetical protein
MALTIPVLLAIALALPSANFQTFDGLPFSHIPEFLGFVLLLPLITSRGLRRLHWRWLASWPSGARAAIGIALGVALGVKVLLLASGTTQGFLACYRSPLEPPVNGPCERSFEHPFFRFSVTRVDRAIYFGEHDWDLGYLNTVRFDPHYVGLQGRLRWRLPIEVAWRGDVERPAPWVARVSYVGEATVVVDADRPASRVATALPPHYGTVAVAFVPVPGGRHSLGVAYRFDDGTTWGGPPPEGPWATLRIERGRGPDGREPGAPVTPIEPPWPWRAAAATGDTALAFLLAIPLVFYVGLLWRDAWILAPLAAVVPLADRFDPAWIGLPSSLGLLVVLALVAAPVPGRRWRRRLLGAFFAMTYVAWFVTLRTFRQLGVVTLRAWAEDPLFFESHARSILDTWSLQGGESVFYYQPLFRYVRFVERLLLGEGDGLVGVLAVAALYWALCWAFARLRNGSRIGRTCRLLFGAIAFSMLALASTPPVVFFIQASLSEYPTWTLLCLLFPMLFASRSPAQWRTGAVLASFCQLLRTNQAPPVGGLLAIFAWRAWRIRPRATVAVVVLALLVMTLPALHNWYYGGRLSLIGDSPAGVHLHIPPWRWRELLHAGRLQIEALDHLDHVFYVHPVRDPFPRGDAMSRIAMRWLQILWLATLVLAFRRRGFAPAAKALLVMLPLLYLGVHVIFVVDDYYPRHIIAGHFAMGLVTLNAVGRGWPRDET